LKQRFGRFEKEHPGLQIEVRIKGAPNESVLDILSTTNSAAPAAMPDLIALSYSQMQAAALAGFLHPLDGLTNLLQEPDWYAFARELGNVQNAEYGIPFACNAMMIVYRPSIFELPPANWNSILNSGTHIAFSISPTHADFPLSLYLSAKGRLIDEQGAFTLDENVLVRVLSLYQRAYEAGAIPVPITEFQTDFQSLNSYRNGDSDFAVVWASSDIGVKSGEYTSLLGLDDVPYSIGEGWVWALAGSNTENQAVAVALASYLVESNYMSQWSLASGYLPTRPLAVDGWEDQSLKTAIDDVLLASHPGPSDKIVAEFSPIMREALTRIFKGEQAEVVARNVMENLK
jgi:ABC-type glycerol-3-phosphate transport system substrate-binding protein